MAYQRYLWTIEAYDIKRGTIHIKVIAKDKNSALAKAKELHDSDNFNYSISDIHEIEEGISTVVKYDVIKDR